MSGRRRSSNITINGYHKNPHQRTVVEKLKKEHAKNSVIQVTGTPATAEKDDTNQPEILHYYDEFYHTTKSLLVLFQIMGVMPIEREVGKTTYSWTSATNMWAYFVFAAETIFVSIVFKERLYLVLKPGKRFDEYIYAIIFLSILIPHFLLPIGAWTNGGEVAKFKNMWTKFQYKYYTVTGHPVKFQNLTLISYVLCVVSWLVGIVLMLAQFYLQEDMLLWHTFAYFHILAMLNCLCSLWFINCTAKGRVAGWLAENLHNALQSSDPASRLGEYRDLWVDLSHMMQQLGKAYSGMYGMYCILVLLTTIMASYGCLTEILDHGLSFKEAGLFLIAFYCMSLLYIICNEAHYTSHKMGPEFRERLLNVNLGAVDNRTRQETVTSGATYLVMLMQFRLSLMRKAAIATRRAAAANVTATSTVAPLF
nr:unnamed protein product [Callosobruchus chinensis]